MVTQAIHIRLFLIILYSSALPHGVHTVVLLSFLSSLHDMLAHPNSACLLGRPLTFYFLQSELPHTWPHTEPKDRTQHPTNN